MMKRFLCLVLCLSMVFACTAAVAEEDYSLTEKLQRQIDFGNGVKGAMQIAAAGDSAAAQLLSCLNGTTIEIRSIKESGGDAFQLYLYTLDGEEQVGLTRFYGDDENLYMSSELLPALVLTYHTGGDLMDALSQRGEDENPNWLTAAWRLMSVPETVWAESWEPLLEGYYADVEVWLADYASEPQVNHTAGGETVMSVRYEIPADAVKAQVKKLLGKALNDEALMTLVRAQATDDQQFTYLTPGLMYYYEAAIDAADLEGEIVLERDLSTMGKTIGTAIQLPLPAASGWETLTMNQDEDLTTLSLTGSAMSIALEMETASSSQTSSSYSGVIRVIREDGEGKNLAAAFILSRVFNHSVDADTREHDVTTWTLNVATDASVSEDEDYMSFEPVSATLMTHIHSKSAKRNATTLEVQASLNQGKEQFVLAGSVKTASPWVMDQLTTEGAEDVTAMTDSYLLEILGSMWSNLMAQLPDAAVEELPDAVDEATATDMSVATVTDATP